MKYFITLFLLLFAVSTRAQITLEHTYAPSSLKQFGLVEVDSGEWKYVGYNGADSITVYSMNHSVERVLIVPSALTATGRIVDIAKHLFELDTSYCYLLDIWIGSPGLRVIKDDGAILFFCDTCSLGAGSSQIAEGIEQGPPHNIRTTADGTKMIVTKNDGVRIYSLPGKLPTCTQKAGIINASSSFADAMLPASAYPNPASGRVRIAYDLPQGVSSGEMILTSEDGREMKRYHVTNAFSDLLIEATDLPSGSYFYKLVTDKGESPAKRIVWMR